MFMHTHAELKYVLMNFCSILMDMACTLLLQFYFCNHLIVLDNQTDHDFYFNGI
jgi:hypothetical protein